MFMFKDTDTVLHALEQRGITQPGSGGQIASALAWLTPSAAEIVLSLKQGSSNPIAACTSFLVQVYMRTGLRPNACVALARGMAAGLVVSGGTPGMDNVSMFHSIIADATDRELDLFKVSLVTYYSLGKAVLSDGMVPL